MVKITLFIVLFILSSCSSNKVLIENTFYPEGPVVINDDLYYVEYSNNLIKRYSFTQLKNFDYWKLKGCGPAGLLNYQGALFVSCYDQNKIYKLSLNKKETKVIDLRSDIVGPNDFAFTSEGILFTASGIFDKESENIGHVALLENNKIYSLDKNLSYPNGIAYIKHLNKVYVSEHFNNRVLEYDWNNGKLLNKKIFIDLPKVNTDPYLGPDGLKYSKKRNTLFVAQYAGSRVYEISLNGEVVNIFQLDNKYPTNLFIKDGIELIITSVKDANNKPYSGNVIKLKL